MVDLELEVEERLPQSKASQEPVRKLPFNIHSMLAAIEIAVRPYPKAMLFQLYDEGFRDSFQQLVACLISIRTLDEVSLVAAKKLLKKYPTAARMAKASAEQINALIAPATFHHQKAYRIKSIAQDVMERFKGELPCRKEALLSFKGVGPKCAHLVLGITCGASEIGVDIHVHRVTNRWGYVHTKSPVDTMEELMTRLPEKYWVDINRLLVPFGKHICTGYRPHCSTCPVLKMCHQIGVRDPR